MEREQLTATVRAAQQGDEKALNLLFNTYYNDVYYFALRTLKDEDLACDITQETFVEIINTLQDLKEPAAFVTWMRQVTYHQCTRYFKKKKEVLVEEDEDGISVFDTLEEEREEFIPGEGVDQEDFRATILALLDTLSEEQRAAVLMHYYHEMSVKDIAEAQKVSEGTVKSRLNYARKSLKKSVEDYEKKHDVKLHCAGGLPLLVWLFLQDSKKKVLPAATVNTIAGGITAATGIAIASTTAGGIAAATATAARTGLIAKIAALPVAVKIISGITAVALLIGSVAVVSDKLGKSPEPTNPAVMQTEPSGDDNPGENDETTAPPAPMETEPSGGENPGETSETTMPSDPTETQPSPSTPTIEDCDHEWSVPDCTTPSICAFCGATEGNPIDHTWEEANYQLPKHCTACSISEGDLLQPAFEAHGLNVIAPQIGVEYDYVTSCVDDPSKKTLGKLYFTEYQTFSEGYENGITFDAETGYKWYYIAGEIYFEDDNAQHYGTYAQFSFADYYDIDGWDENAYFIDNFTISHTVSYYGVDYPECRIVLGRDEMTQHEDGFFLYYFQIYWRVPDGYDGFVLCLKDNSLKEEAGQHIYDTIDENSLLFRFGSAAPERPITEPTDAQLKRCIDTSDWGGGTETDAWDKAPGEECSVKLSYTHVIKERESAAYDIVGTEVLSATLNGVACTVYQTNDPDSVRQLVISEGPGDYDDEYIAQLHTVFLVESPTLTVILDEDGRIIADYSYIVRVYLSDGTHRDLEFGSEEYSLRRGFGGMITSPEHYE